MDRSTNNAVHRASSRLRWIGMLTCGLLWALGATNAWGNTVTKVTLVMTDAQGNVLMTKDPQGHILARYTYRPYGTQQSGPTNRGPGYTGHVNDPDTGLVYMQQRYYDPAVGRFISPDPVAPAPGNVFNFGRYTYANDNPVVNIDPDGRQEVPEEDLRRDGRMESPGQALHDSINEFEGKSILKKIKNINPNYKMPSAVGPPGEPYFSDVIVSKLSGDLQKLEGDRLPKTRTGPGSVPKSERDKKRLFTPSEREKKRAEQGGKCANCGKDIDGSNSRGHHIVRHADGGRTVPENHAEVCPDCHKHIHSGE